MKLRLFTANYPYGYGESFLNNELPQLKKGFDEVVIYPFITKANVQSVFDDKTEVVVDDKKNEKYNLSFNDKLFTVRVILLEVFKSGRCWYVLKNFRKMAAILKQSILLSKWIKTGGMSPFDAYYSFWMNEWALALAVLKKRTGSPNFVMRVNGYDIYNERQEGNYLPFRYFVYTQVTKVYSPSPTSANYLKQLKMFPEKMTFSFFGTKDHGPADERSNEKYVVFSCSSAIPLKRLDKIADVICCLDFPVVWVHHGDGPTYDKVTEKMNNAPSNIQFMSSTKVDDYSQVLEKQKTIAPDLFINLSTSEGLPVTMIEALSFGTPLLANDVGSCRDVITPLTGVLVRPDDSPESIAKEITKLRDQNKRIKDGAAIREYWRENFFAETNYARFAQEIRKQLKDN